jgi:hypothetical protein
MKRISFIMIALVAMSSFSCGLLDKADVSINVTLPLEFPAIDETGSPTPGGATAYSGSKLLDAKDNAEVAKYKDKIKEFKVNKVYYEITEKTKGDGVIFTNGSLSVGGKKLASKTTQTIAVTPKTEFTGSEIDIIGVNALADALKADLKATVVYSGTFSKTPVAFKVKAYFDCTIVASAIK